MFRLPVIAPCPHTPAKKTTTAFASIIGREWWDVASIALVLVCGIILLLALHAPARAQNSGTIAGPEADEETIAISVPYTPEDLADPARARRLYQRLDHAALKACGGMDGQSFSMRSLVEQSPCHKESLSRALTALHDDRLTRLAATHIPPFEAAEQTQ